MIFFLVLLIGFLPTPGGESMQFVNRKGLNSSTVQPVEKDGCHSKKYYNEEVLGIIISALNLLQHTTDEGICNYDQFLVMDPSKALVILGKRLKRFGQRYKESKDNYRFSFSDKNSWLNFFIELKLMEALKVYFSFQRKGHKVPALVDEEGAFRRWASFSALNRPFDLWRKKCKLARKKSKKR